MLRKIYKYAAGLVIVALALNSCIKDDPGHTTSGGEGDKVRLTLYTNTAGYTNPSTRGDADEDGIDAPMVLVFDGQDDDAAFVEAVQSETSGGETIVTLTRTDKASTILLMANAPQGKFRNATAGTDVAFTEEGVTGAMRGMTLGDVEDVLRTVPLDNLQKTAPFTSPRTKLPVSGIRKVTGIDENTDLGKTQKLWLARSVAKATVTVDAALFGFTLYGAGVVNAPMNGGIYRHGTALQDNTSNTTRYLTVAPPADGVSGMAPAVANTTAATPLYIYESDKDMRTALIIKADYEGTDYYYKLGFYYEEEFRPVERNKDYKFTIKSAARGYADIGDAINGIESNVVYEIEVTDSYAHDMVSNELYYLGLSNSEVIVFGTQETITNAFTVTTDASDHGVTTGSVSYTTTGGSGTITGTTAFALSAPGTLTAEAFDITMPSSVTSGTAVITVGSLDLTVNFTREQMLNFSGYGELPGDYVSCEITDRGDNDRLYLSVDGSTRGSGPLTLGSAGKVYVMSNPNIVPSGGVYRDAGKLYAVRRYGDGTQARTKIILEQDFIETGNVVHTPPPEGRTYVGAFWRNEQTGERLIRIPYQSDGGVEGRWSATVIDGADWIKLDKEKTEDPGVTWKAGAEAPADMNDPDNDALYQVTGNAISVGGMLDASAGDYIYFRIGLKSRIPDGAKPRYGLVWVQYNNGSKTFPIYIRHGHEPDYLMRNGTVDASAIYSQRTLATEYSPYNLTAQGFKDDNKSTDEFIKLDRRDESESAGKGWGKFTDYPSQAGAYFLWGSSNSNATVARYAYSPYIPQISNGNWNPYTTGGFWSALRDAQETCPPGYRRPTDGSITGFDRDPVTSEQRESLWLNPTTDENCLWGYYADGFFDRWAIVDAVGLQATKEDSAVCVEDTRVAYMGWLLYNPNNNAGLFFPATGYRYVTDPIGRLAYPGNECHYWTATTTGDNIYFYISTLNMRFTIYPGTYKQIIQQRQVRRNQGSSIRCVVE